MSSADRSQVLAMTRQACERVCQTRDCSGLQMALYRSMAMATRLNVETETEMPAGSEGQHHLQPGVARCGSALPQPPPAAPSYP